jgi:hypothetical protein
MRMPIGKQCFQRIQLTRKKNVAKYISVRENNVRMVNPRFMTKEKKKTKTET